MINLVYNSRRQAHKGDKLSAMEDIYLNPKGNANSLMQFNMAYADIHGAQRIIGFGKMELVNTLRAKKSKLHIDATFDCCPKGFYQCLIVSIFIDTNGENGLFLPCFYILMSKKSRGAYVMALSSLNNLLGGAMDPQFVMHDFEVAMRQGIAMVFPGTRR